MGIFTSARKNASINWTSLENEEQLDELIQQSFETPVLIFKHSTRCSISSMAKNRLENDWNIADSAIVPVYLDLLNFRSISNAIAQKTGVEHQSPQAILIRNGAVVYHSSHDGISANDIKKLVE